MDMLKRRGIIAIGNLLVDQSLCCTEYPQESMLTQITHVNKSCGGGCTNVLFDLARLDPALPLALSGVIGHDEYGDFILQEAARHNINTARVHVSDQDATSFTHVVVNSQNGQRTFFHHLGANHRLSAEHFSNLDNLARIAHVAYMLLLPALEQKDNEWQTSGVRALVALQQQGFEVSLDLVSAPEIERYQLWVKPVLPYVDYLIINDEEASRLCQCPVGKDYFEQARSLLKMGVRKLVCIHYPKGAVAVDVQGNAYKVDAYHVPSSEIVSTLGAGDAFCAGMLYGIHENWPLVEALRLGCASAHFNLFSLSATEGARILSDLNEFIQHKEGKV
ncbi:sugar kinase ydjH [Salmonella enterica subsp. enterica serovar Bovismorbificans]|uniref:Sugar kinase ydjH n=1 Tax=Salmonella enterica subsp. enterica serovar Bovismorbificans TaxID=58097 RepID=A0A655EJR2_SALET|nr:sugar kinase ydjH [Salmonella enterica subsp. enterica serovar Bovismorbificans]